MTNPIDKVFDSRDLKEYVIDLQEEILDRYNELIDEINNEHVGEDDWADLDNAHDYDELDTVQLNWIHEIDSGFFPYLGFTDIEDLKELFSFYDELSQYGEFKYGETIIRDDYWVEYCEEFCKDIGEIPKDLPWYIANHIDWEGVANEIASDYAEIFYDSNYYYIRNT